MSKWKRVLLISMFFIFLTGLLVGITMEQTAAIKGESNIFEIVKLIFLIIAAICLAWDMINALMMRKSLGERKFKLVATTRKGLKAVLVVFIILFISNLLILIISKDISSLPVCIFMLMAFANQAFHYVSENSIGENGIINWGIYHNWDNIKKYKIGDNCLVEFDITKKGLGMDLENRASFYCNEEEKEAIGEFLKEKCKS